MNEQYPFHYEVRFRLIAIKDDEPMRHEKWAKIFDTKNPKENRADAFEAFDDYMHFLDHSNRLAQDKKGNFYILKPEFSSEQLRKPAQSEKNETFPYREDILVILVIDDPEIRKEFESDIYIDDDEKGSGEYVIHRVSSLEFEAQEIIDNLEMNEYALYRHFNINVDELVETVYHYGLDYAESGGDEEGGAKRIILRTPFIWNTKDDYREEYETENGERSAQGTIQDLVLDIISRGENKNVEFKPSLLYNFKTNAAGISVKYIIAKTICGLLNSDGGILLIGVQDNGTIEGLENSDFSLFPDSNAQDKLSLEFDSLQNFFLGLSVTPFIDTEFVKMNDEKTILMVDVKKSSKPVFLLNKRNEVLQKEFYIRMTASTRQITDIEELAGYILNRDWE